MGIREFLSRIFFWKRKPIIKTERVEITKRVMQETGLDIHDIGGGPQGLDPQKVHVFVNRRGSQATHQDISKFMKHGRQSPQYRKSMKQHLSPEED